MSAASGKPIGCRAIAAVLAVVGAAARCGDGPTTPTPTPNTPPVVRAVTVDRMQIDSGQELEVTAVVDDAETLPHLLRYAWTAQAGNFTGDGRSVRWRAPADGPASEYTLGVTVTESYTGAGGVLLEHRVMGTSPAVRVNDGIREMRLLAGAFLADFSDSTKSAEFCVRNFTDSCRGKRDELEDIRRNRRDYTIISNNYSLREITLNSGWLECSAPTGPGSCALVTAPVEWVSRLNQTGVIERVRGEALLSGVYEQQRWWLCDSRFVGQTLLKVPFLR